MTAARVLLAALAWCAVAPAAAAWGPEERLTTNTTVAETGLNRGALAMDAGGRLTVAWAEQDGPDGNFQIHTRTRQPSGVWNPAELAVAWDTTYAGTLLGAKFPALAHVDGDSLLLVWHDYRVAGILNLELYTKIRGPGMPWGGAADEVRLTTTNHPETLGDNSYVPNLAVDPAGEAHVAWYDFRYDADNAEILFKSRVDGAWDLTPGDAPDTSLSLNAANSEFAAVAAGADGALHVAWRDNESGFYRIAARRRAPDGTWEPRTWLSPDGTSAAGVALAAAPDGTVLAVWSDGRTGSQAVYAREHAAGTWGPPRRVSPDGVGAEEPAAAVGPTGRRHVVWHDAREGVFNREVFHQAVDAGAAWDSTGVSDTRLSNGAGRSVRPTVLAGAGGTVHVVWQDERHGPAEIYHRALLDVTAAGVPPRPAPRAAPNPFRAAVEVSGWPDGVATAHVVDVRGRRVAVMPVRGGRLTWRPGNHVPPGVYFLRAPDGSAAARVVRLP